MNKTHLKKIIAREWLILLSTLIVGIIFTDIIFFMNSSEYIIPRKNLYESLKYEYKESNRFDPTTARPMKDLGQAQNIKPTSFISYSEFNNILSNNSRRKQFYDSIRASDYDLGDYETFEREVTKPTFYSGLSKLFDHLFSKWYWFSTLLSLLIPYIGLQFIRSVYYSVRLLATK
jgi:hypothetical protein